MIKLSHVTKKYALKSGDVTALSDVTLSFGDSGLVFILGKSGSGKTTLLNILGGIDKPTSGELLIDGTSGTAFKEKDFDAYRNTSVGFVFQEYNLLEDYTAGANVALALELQGAKADKGQIDEVLRKVGLTEQDGGTLYGRKINELSGGQKQRVAIARALIKNPDVILADEPTGALDSETGKQLYELLKELAKEKLVIVVTHDRESAEQYGDRVIQMADGKIVRDSFPLLITEKNGNPAAKKWIKSHLPLKRCFIMGAGGLRHKTIRLILSLVLAVFAFTFFGFSLTAATADSLSAELRTLYENGYSYAFVQSENYYLNANTGYECGWRYVYGEDASVQKSLFSLHSGTGLYSDFTEEQQDLLSRSRTNFLIQVDTIDVPDFSKNLAKSIDEIYLENDFDEKTGTSYMSPYLLFLIRGFDGAAELNPSTGENDLNLSPDGRFLDKSLCRLPKNTGEIAITDLKADLFMRYGYVSDDGVVYDIAAPDDLIGKTIGGLTVCGVYSTEESADGIRAYGTDPCDLSEDRYADYWLDGCHILNFAFVCEGYYAERGRAGYGCAILPLSGRLLKDKNLIESLSYEGTQESVYHGETYAEEVICSVSLLSAYSGFVAAAGQYMYEEVKQVLSVVCAVFIVVSVLTAINFLLAGIDARKREIGILRALGAGKKDVVRICLCESLLITGAEFLLTLSAVGVICLVLNGYFYVSLFFIGFIPFASLFLLCFGTMAIATVFPVLAIARKKPIDIIYKK